MNYLFFANIESPKKIFDFVEGAKFNNNQKTVQEHIMLKPNNTQTFMKVYERELRELEVRKTKLLNLIRSMKELSGKNKKDDKSATLRKGRPLLPKTKELNTQPVNMTMAIKEFLYESKKEQTIGDILDGILAKGAIIQSDNPKNVISTTLYRLKKTGMVIQNKNGWKIKGK